MTKFRANLLLFATPYFVFSSAGIADTLTANIYSPLPPSGSTSTVINLSTITPPSQSAVTGAGYSIAFSGVSGNEGVVQGTSPGAHATPVAGVTGGTTAEYLTNGFGSALTTNVANSGNYFSTGVGSITITFSSPQDSLALLWGSIDGGNSLAFNDAASLVVTGSAVQKAAAGFVGNGYQGPGGSAYIVVDTSTPFTTVTADSSIVSFEFAAVAGALAPFTFTPEPGNLTLLGTGGGFLFCLLFLCRTQTIKNID